MVKVKLKQKNPENLNEWIEKEIYLDGYIKSNLDIGVQQLHDDFDQVWFVDGAEGAGKSDFMAQAAYYVNDPETRHSLIDRICTTAETFDAAILSAKPFDAVVLDEAFGSISATGSMGKVNRVLQRRFTEIRSKNLFIFIGAPSFMDIMRYFAIWRSKCLIHIYLSKERKRGFGAFYGEKKKRKLYILGKKQFYNYNVVSPQFTFRFIKQMHMVIDKVAYDTKKNAIQSMTADEEKAEKNRLKLKGAYMKVIYNLWKDDPKRSQKEMSRLTGISQTTISDYLAQIKANFLGNQGFNEDLATI